MKRTLALLIVLAVAPAALGQAKETPNLMVDISVAALSALVSQSVDRTEPVDEVIQEAPVKGMGRTIGTVTAELVPDTGKGIVEIVFRGQINSETTATRPLVLVNTTSVTLLEVRRRIVIDGKSIQSIAGANFGKSTATLRDIKGRNQPDSIVTRIAAEGFKRSKNDAEFESATKAAWNISKRMGAEITPLLAKISAGAMAQSEGLKRIGLKLEALEFSSSAGGLHGRVRIGSPGRDIKPSPEPSKGVDLGVRIHQSMINEAAQAVYGGKSFSMSEVQQFYEDLTKGMLEGARKEGDGQDNLKKLQKLLAAAGSPVTVTFAEKNPFLVTVGENGFTFEIDIASIRQDKNVYEGMRVKADYKFENVKEGIHLVRKGPVKFLPATPTDKKLTPLPFAFGIIRELVFAELLKDQFVMTTLPLPEAFAKVRFQPPRVGARDGWFALAWTLAP